MTNLALAGNPNSGKTTLFNTLTGAHQHVGNWPGKTVEKKTGKLTYKGKEISIIDLPGTYSLTSFTIEERITRNHILNDKPDIVLDVVDATNIQRNLYLALQLIELKPNLVIVLNMSNIADRKGIIIDTEKMSKILGVPVIKADVRKKSDALDILSKSIDYYSKQRPWPRLKYGKDMEEYISSLKELLDGDNRRWKAVRILENDKTAFKDLSKAAKEEYDKIKAKLKIIYGKDHDTIISDRRHGIASGIVKETVKKQFDRISKSDLVDKFITNRFFGIPIFLIVIYLLFQLTFTLADPFVGYIGLFVSWFGEIVKTWLIGTPVWLGSLIADGIIGGLGSVIVFLPNIFILFFLISLLEDSGYFARAAYIMDNFMHKLGLHGKSFIPLMLGFGCNVPAIMATRTLDSKKDRILTILITPFMSCSARLPVYVLFVGAFFSQNQGLVLFSLYLLGIVVAILSGILFNKVFFKGKSSELVMELPPYRIPTLFGAIIHMWERGKLFIYKAGTIIFSAVIVIWFLSNLPFGTTPDQSIIAMIGKFIAPIFAPLGFGNWQSAVALLFGIVAKEVIIGTFGTLYAVGEAGLTPILQNVFTPLSAYAFMVLTLIYMPCIAVVATMKRETGSWKWVGIMGVYSLLIGWILAFIVYQGGLLIW